MAANETEPLLPSDRQAARDAEDDHIHRHINWLAPAGKDSYLHTTRTQIQRFLASKTGHYAVLLLVSLDVACIFADFLVSLYVCEHSSGKSEGETDAQVGLGVVSLVFSCLFMVELLASIWAFGLPFFQSWFHCFDATVIIASFVIDVALRGVLEEVGSIVIVLRLWRVFKIIEEFSTGAEEQMEALTERLESLETENRELKKELSASRGHETP